MTMQIRSVRIESFASIRQMEIAGLEPGLNIVVGDNEAGKSTVLAALRAAFFHRHRAQTDAVREFMPNDGIGRPEVAVEFRLGSVDYTLTKSFLTRPQAQLAWPGGQLEGDAVEDRLAELIGFSHPARGAPKLAEHQGAFGLLWIQQGRAPEGVDVGAARNMLAASLEGEMGHFLGGGQGEAMLAAARSLQDRFFTATLRVRTDSPLRLAEDELTALRQSLAELEELQRRYEAKLERLGDRRRLLARYEAEDAVGKADKDLAVAQDAARRVDGLQEAHRLAERAVEQARQSRARAVELVKRRLALQADREAAVEAVQAAAQEQQDCRGKLSLARQQLEAADAAVAEARRAEEAAEEAERHRSRDAELQRLIAALADLRERREAVLRAMAIQAGSEPFGSAEPITKAALEQIETAFLALREAEIRLSAASAHIRFEPVGQASIFDAAGQAVAPGADLPVSGTAQFSIEGFGGIVVKAGGETEEFVRRAEEARRNWLRLSGHHGVDNLDQARTSYDRSQEQAAQRRQAAADVARLAPAGLAALELEIVTLEKRQGQLAAEHAPDRPALALSREEAASARRTAEDALAQARGFLTALSEQAVRADVRHEHAVARAAQAESGLQSAAGAEPLEKLQDAVAAAEQELVAAEAALAARARDAATSDPEVARLELDRAGRAREQLVRTLRDLSQEVHGLEGELRVEGASALEERIARLGGEIEHAERRVARLSVEAEASRLLYSTLEECRSDARERWLGPLKEKVAPYLRLVQPGGIIEFDDATMDVRSIVRNGVEEPFYRLSHGAREQVAVVTRLAIAEILREAGHPAFVILDDALVNTDEKRLARMHLALGRAAASMQVIVLTCRERDFIGLGASLHRI
ncbi:AAA family ATPase [Aureimonas altamirensis]|uniref:AAA family ATPase n=1 Tax=Aureimonas altamirensis TaxID=370622 RepID=UPI00301720C9